MAAAVAMRFFMPHLKAFLDIEPVDQLLVDLVAFTLRQDMQSAISIMQYARTVAISRMRILNSA